MHTPSLPPRCSAPCRVSKTVRGGCRAWWRRCTSGSVQRPARTRASLTYSCRIRRAARRVLCSDFAQCHPGLTLATWCGSHSPAAYLATYPGSEGDTRRTTAEREAHVADPFWDAHLKAYVCAGTECKGAHVHVVAGTAAAQWFCVCPGAKMEAMPGVEPVSKGGGGARTEHAKRKGERKGERAHWRARTHRHRRRCHYCTRLRRRRRLLSPPPLPTAMLPLCKSIAVSACPHHCIMSLRLPFPPLCDLLLRYSLNASNGAKVWGYRTQGRVRGSPSVYAGYVYAGSEDHSVQYSATGALAVERVLLDGAPFVCARVCNHDQRRRVVCGGVGVLRPLCAASVRA